MASKSGSKPSSPRLSPKRGNISSLQNYVIVKVILKTLWGETEGLMLLYWSVLFVSGRVVRQGRWEGSEVGRWGRWEGSEVVRWERWKGSEVARWERWENGEAEKWEAPGFIQGWGTQDNSKISSCF